ncbi:hypothetical protein HID58_029388 [Brassica napus]|uniref:Uncharacterized protein n=1 Tax=Brassica napus TaxID=3708 RepID=A0ABQ8CCZ1_BRANA|nr:hypothetical protein HID58_029388 [Brassica napus]
MYDGRIISCFLRKEEETTNILGFHGEILGPKQEPAPLEKNTTSRSKSLRGTSTTTLVRHDASEDMVNCKRVVTSMINGESKEAAVVVNKPSVCAAASGEKRPLTVPKGPNFHCIHVPKSCCCTNRMASHVYKSPV